VGTLPRKLTFGTRETESGVVDLRPVAPGTRGGLKGGGLMKRGGLNGMVWNERESVYAKDAYTHRRRGRFKLRLR
jgi:hypothetical protein